MTDHPEKILTDANGKPLAIEEDLQDKIRRTYLPLAGQFAMAAASAFVFRKYATPVKLVLAATVSATAVMAGYAALGQKIAKEFPSLRDVLQGDAENASLRMELASLNGYAARTLFQQHPHLIEDIRTVAEKAAFKDRVDLCINDDKTTAAIFAGPDRHILMIGHEHAMKLDRAQLRAVVAHEITHMINNDHLTQMLRQMGGHIVLGGMAASVFRGGGFSMLPKMIGMNALNFATFTAARRQQEWRADEGAAILTGEPQAMSSALDTIFGEGTDLLRDKINNLAGLKGVAARAYLKVAEKFLAQHPTTPDRVAVLNSLQVKPQM